MPHFPLISRLSSHEYVAILLGFILVGFENVLRVIIAFLPKPVINWFYDRSRSLFIYFIGHPLDRSKKKRLADRIRKACDFEDLCNLFGYKHEEHVVLTKDGYLLGLHRIPSRRNEPMPHPGSSTGKPVVYLHHGLLMNSEVWVCLTDPARCLPFVLAERGFDVWLGNNRGNKYSKKSIHHNPNEHKFWDFSIDDFAWHDIPDSIEYILKTTGTESVGYVGFSQGSAQAFAALSIHPQLNQKVNVFVALAPSMKPAGLAAPIVDGLMKASPSLLFLIFGRKVILSSAVMWQSILYPPIFNRVIDIALDFLFSWKSHNITPFQKLAAYAHLYSFASTKSVVHWFQIMRNSRFVMYDDEVYTPFMRVKARSGYSPVKFPTHNIATRIVLFYGDCDSLVDIDTMLHELPRHTETRRLRGYEHLDILWGENVHIDVIPDVVAALKRQTAHPEKLNGDLNGVQLTASPNLDAGSRTPEIGTSGYATSTDN
ncbi:hypothetical protein EVG20_g7920 [Dentipellis fragilis]|uniref:Partial AB-hydrolase lipase domain-containing protein n=1 Tax=Dentipellis fragilis TaxID=205917 RepID=A0A4Y9YAL1_9AGAM|nr:hypothetical protein EVG20_g7920 [Dentipellis fragilis]